MLHDLFNDALMFLSGVLVATGLMSTRGTASCPDGYDMRTGVRASGVFECWPHLVGDPNWDGTWKHAPDRSIQPEPITVRRVLCDPGVLPVITSGGQSVICCPSCAYQR